MKIRKVNHELYVNYLKKATEFYEAAKTEFEKQNWNSCVLNAIHCAISSTDALTVFFNGVRHAGDKHFDSINLLQELNLDKNLIKDKTRHLFALLDVKNMTEYEEKLTTEDGAILALKHADRFFGWVKEVTKK